MSKPDWSEAPEWAQFLAMDHDGEWFWYATEPRMTGGYWVSDGRSEYASHESRTWRETLERRP